MTPSKSPPPRATWRRVRRPHRRRAAGGPDPRVAETGVETWAQHVSAVEHGSHTGSTLAEAAADAGAVGTLLNHSENRLKLADIDGALDAADRADLETIVCANNPAQIGAAAALDPDGVAVEPPELIGTARPSARQTQIS